MPKIIVSTFASLDGVSESPEKWSSEYFDQQNQADSLELLLGCDALLLGRRTYEAFAGAWPQRTEDPSGFADKMNTMTKYVVSTTLQDPEWENTEVIADDVFARIGALKEGSGGDLLVYGSPTLMAGLMERDLIDEFNFLLSPVVVGSGAKLFGEGAPARKLSLVDVKGYDGGMTRWTLQRKPA